MKRKSSQKETKFLHQAPLQLKMFIISFILANPDFSARILDPETG